MLENSLGYLLNASARLMKRDLDLKLKDYGLTSSQWATLQLLSQEESLTQAEIAKRTNSDRATIGGVIDRMIDKGLLEKQVMKSDRRHYVVDIAADGMKLYQTIESFGSESNEKATEGLAKADIETLKESLTVIIENLRGEF